MSSIRYCGSLRIRVTYVEPRGEMYSDGTLRDVNGTYRCNITPYTENTDIITVYVGAPAFLSHDVDSSEAFDAAASAALAFAADGGWPVDAYAEFNAFSYEGESTYVISRKAVV